MLVPVKAKFTLSSDTPGGAGAAWATDTGERSALYVSFCCKWPAAHPRPGWKAGVEVVDGVSGLSQLSLCGFGEMYETLTGWRQFFFNERERRGERRGREG